MTRITLKIQQPTGEVERHIDRANGAPAVEAAMCCDDGTGEIGQPLRPLFNVSRVADRECSSVIGSAALTEGEAALPSFT